MDEKCLAPNKDGSACSAAVWRDQLCRWHHPDLEAARVAGRRKGGRNKSNAQRAKKAAAAMTTAHIDALLAVVLTGVLDERYSPGQAQAAAVVARAMLAVREAGALERVEARLADLERLAARQGQLA
jgi:hypothetical protein